jgi:UDPglucose 6-dehydrogenase
MSVERVSVVGLGKLGLCLAAVMAEAGLSVWGVDLDSRRVESVNAHISPIVEPGLQECLSRLGTRLRATTDISVAVKSTHATFIVVPTPSKPDGGFSLDYVLSAIESIGEGVRSKSGYHLVVVTSTVMPGSMGGQLRESLARSSGKEIPAQMGLCYNPEFIALGDVLRGLRQPDFILIGESDPRAGDLLEEIQRKVVGASTRITRMNYQNAEVAKIAVNSYVTMKISFANSLAEICERMKGLDVDTVTGAIGLDSRIGTAYLRGGLGFGGPCFPRDNLAFARLAEDLGAQALLARATQQVNDHQVKRVVSIVKSSGLLPPARISVLGLTYKPDTPVTEASQSLQLAQMLVEEGFTVRAYDPSLTSIKDAANGKKFTLTNSIQECVEMSDLCILATPWEEFHQPRQFLPKGLRILDCWRLLDSPGYPNLTAIGRSA